MRLPILIYLLAWLKLSQTTCDFDVSDCGFRINEPWMITNKIYIPNVFNGPPTQLGHNGNFLVAQGKFGGDPNGNVSGPIWSESEIPKSVKFVFAKSTHSTKLDIILATQYGSKCIDSVIGVGLLQWNLRTVVIPPVADSARLIFRVIGIRSSFDVVALDDIEFEQYQKSNTPEFALSLDDNNIRRAPMSTNVPSCEALNCVFKSTTCAWEASGNWTLFDDAFHVVPQEFSHLSAPPILLPPDVYLELRIRAQPQAHFNVFAISGAAEDLIWTQDAVLMSSDWTNVRIPIRSSTLPTQLRIELAAADKGSMSLESSKLVNSMGQAVKCDSHKPIIKPQNNNIYQRLTAVQQLDETAGPKIPFPPLDVNQAALLPISPSIVNAPKRATSKLSSIRNRKLNLPSQRIHHSPFHSSGPAPLISASVDSTDNFKTPQVTEFLRAIGATPAMASQLNSIARRLGFNNLSPDEARQALESAKQLFKNPLSIQLPKLDPGTQPIKPIVVQSNEMRDLKSMLPSQASINADIVKKLGSVISLPQTQLDTSRPLSRGHLDFIVQNAYKRLLEDKMHATLENRSPFS